MRLDWINAVVEGWWGGEKAEAVKGEHRGAGVVVGKEERPMVFSTGITAMKEKRRWLSILTFLFSKRTVWVHFGDVAF
jgi:hypothetical protein